ncbi:MAG TPA: cellulose synthase operon protein YhjQ/BcsQ [Terracidiphilus sp.]|nr:cellulose synthase operon protein YhjQ/BcsQ [Terracidiphilus sp.]
MGDSQVLNDLNESPENSSTPRARARQHGAKHREFSASRLQARERARQRVQRAIEEERERAREEAESRRAAVANRAIDPAEQSQQTAQAVIDTELGEHGTSRQLAEAKSASLAEAQLVEESENNHLHSAEVEDEERPAWLSPLRAEVADYVVPNVPADTLQGARDRLASRWFALKGFEGAAAAAKQYSAAAAAAASPCPVVAIFSLAGGVGKSSLAATLARTLSARGERILLVETAPHGMLPFFFGARDQRPGELRTFAPPQEASDAPVKLIALDPESLSAESDGPDPLTTEISRCAQNTGRIIVDIATASTAVARRVLRMAPMLLVPLAPDMNSVVNAGFIDSVFHRTGDGRMNSSEVYYVLNQFDPSLPLHLDVREVLRERLGDRLLPFALRRAPAVSEALAEGMTVLDYAPASPVAEDFDSLASWIRTRSAPAGAAPRGMRWVEK